MKILNKQDFKELIDKNPGAKFAFYEYTPCIFKSELHILDGDYKYPYFGATTLSASAEEGEEFIFDYDWNLNEYSNDEQFAVLEKGDIAQLQELLDESTGL